MWQFEFGNDLYLPGDDDIGDPPGYENFCEAMVDPKHPDHAEMVDWHDGDWDAEAFERCWLT